MTSVLDPRVRVDNLGQQGSVAAADRPQDGALRSNWQQDAACRSTDASYFFPPDRERESARTKRIARAKTVCMQCPVLAECRAYALQVGEWYGVWGGLSEDERPQQEDQARKVSELDARSKITVKRRRSAAATR